MTAQDNKNFDSRAFRNAMGSFATGITVVTMAKPDGSLKAMTANAFSSVSLEPPMLLVCIDKGASMHEWLDHVDAFGVNICQMRSKMCQISSQAVVHILNH